MAKASAAGHRVVLVCATRGEQGEPVEGVLNEGETLAERRVVELATSCEILGAEPPRFLDYEDSGMIDEPENENPASFWQADHDEAVERFATILREVDADVVTIYDNHGGYGHPDHIRVHTVGLAATQLVGTEHVFESTMNRDALNDMLEQNKAEGGEINVDFDEEEVATFGTALVDLSFEIDVSAHIAQKKQAIIAHASQVAEDSFFLSMPDEIFTAAFGSEVFNVPGVTNTGGPQAVDILPGLN